MEELGVGYEVYFGGFAGTNRPMRRSPRETYNDWGNRKPPRDLFLTKL